MARDFRLPQTNYYLYELECEKGKRYIGVTSCPIKRMAEHRKGKGSRWTKKYKPLKIKRILSLGDMSYQEACIVEDYETLKLLCAGKYGVRGGRYLDPKIKFDKIKLRDALNNIPDDYKELVFEPVEIDFEFRYKKEKSKKPRKKANGWEKQARKAERQLKANQRKFGVL